MEATWNIRVRTQLQSTTLRLLRFTIPFTAMGMLFSPAARAQSAATVGEDKPLAPPAPTKPRLGGLSILLGGMFVDQGPLNDRLAAAEYPNDLASIYPIIGGEGFGVISHFLIGGSGVVILPRGVDGSNDTEVSASGGWGTVDFGYQVVRRDGLLVAPLLSLGGYDTSLKIASKEESSFDEVLEDPQRSATLTSKGALGGISIVVKYILLNRAPADVPDAKAGWALGLRIGALYGIPIGDWQADNAETSDDPTLGLRGAYLSLSLGRGGW